MIYTKKLALIPTTEGIKNLTLTVAEGTGLGYAYWPDQKHYTITALLDSERLTVSPICCPKEERVAQLFIDELCKLTNWTQDKDTILKSMKAYSFHPYGIIGRIEDACGAAHTAYEKELQAQPA